ncbi:alpha/beta hydrolase family protein [Jiella pacifica]|uniref:Alpha/beta fold hydrolase n=1 Tax=Jiella pacifica TaxID=2696469 RepID=A0A6N9T7F7_9HYPH|nr:alpha/beta fold hydrolase [Jiella pacifica]NDW07337.1 alpha/beta fold hydrolase [Jiella pacifica]
MSPAPIADDDALEPGDALDPWPGKASEVATSHLSVDAGPKCAPVAVTCRWPQDTAPKAYVVFCHGLGAGGNDYGELSAFLAAHGYLVIHPTFPDWIGAVATAEPGLGYAAGDPDLLRWTTIPALRARLYEILHTPFYWLERIRMVRAVMADLDTIVDRTCGRPIRPMPGVIAGHSFGAYTAQILAGVEIDVPGDGLCDFADERFKAAVLLSVPGRGQQGLRDGSWNRMSRPALIVTGTKDEGSRGQDWVWKTEPFELAPPGDKYLAIFADADHYLGGMTENDPTPHRPDQKQAVFRLTLAFLDAHVPNEGAAARWLASIDDRIGDCPVTFKRNSRPVSNFLSKE